MKILIATDGSVFSQHAIEKACEIAEGRENVSFRVISVHEAPVPMAAEPFAISAEHYQQLGDLARRRAEETVRKTTDFIKERFHGNPVEVTTVVELGTPAQWIVEEARTWRPDLLVMGSHGYGFWGRLALGSVSDAVVHHAPCSVLIVKSMEEGH